MALVIGSGMDALRAAAMLASTGASVCLLQESETPHGLAHPELDEGDGRLRIESSFRTAAEGVLGPLTEGEPVRRSVAKNGSLQALPLRRLGVARLFERDHFSDTGLRFLERRLRNNLIPLTGEGQEERTYREWVIRRMGEPAYRHAYAPYAERRWGLKGDMLSVAVARAFHNPQSESPVLRVKAGPESAIARATAVIENNGGEIVTSATVRAMEVKDGRVVSVRVGRKKYGAGDGPIWVARTPSVVATWLGDALDSGGHVDANCLEAHDRVRIAMTASWDGAAEEVHLLDPDAVGFRVSRLPGNDTTVVVDLTMSPYAPDPNLDDVARCVRGLGWRDVDPTTARIERHHEWVPLWAPVVHPRLRRLSLSFRELGVAMVGRRGTFAPIGPGTELMIAARYSGDPDPDQREAMRVLFAPPVKDDDLDASFRDFIWR
ncbi:MAG: hypothetical protein VX944_13500 [Myxococcota bacterium]|nr:hypothetical protein [Myxococcota bacterium]